MRVFIFKLYTCFSSLWNFRLFNHTTKIPLSIYGIFSFEDFDMTIRTEQKLLGLEQSQLCKM